MTSTRLHGVSNSPLICHGKSVTRIVHSAGAKISCCALTVYLTSSTDDDLDAAWAGVRVA